MNCYHSGRTRQRRRRCAQCDSNRMKEKRAALDGIAAELRRIIGKHQLFVSDFVPIALVILHITMLCELIPIEAHTNITLRIE